MYKILRAIKCKKCDAYLVDPVLLPCSHSICQRHVDEAGIINKRTIKCGKCGKDHVIPRTGFVRIDALSAIMNTRIGESTWNVVYEEAYHMCQTLQECVSNVEDVLKDPMSLHRDEINELEQSVLKLSDDVLRKNLRELNQILKKAKEYKSGNWMQLNSMSPEYNTVLKDLTDKLKVAKDLLTHWNNELNKFDFSVSEANCKKVKEVAESVNEELKELVKSLKKEGYIHLIEGLKNNIEAMETGNKKEKIVEIDSVLLDESLFSQLQELLQIKAKKATLLYRGSRDGFMASDFHSRCDNFGDTLTVVKSTSGHIFGGYTNQKWNYTGENEKKRNVGFIFSLVNSVNKKKRFSFEQALSNDKYWLNGPSFGARDETRVFRGLIYYLHICNKSNVNKQSFCNLSKTFKYPDFITEGDAFLAGSTSFTVAEIEVFQIKKKSSHKKAKNNKN